MKKRPSPRTPYREKAKGKEIIPGCFKQPISPRGRARTRYRLANAAAMEVINILNANYSEDFRLWAYYCYHHDIDLILDKAHELASRHRQGELANPVTAFQHWLSTSFGGAQ